MQKKEEKLGVGKKCVEKSVQNYFMKIKCRIILEK